MIGNVVIENFKSITKLDLELGRINVLIGANGCGKSNILEAIALCGAAAADKLDNEFLAPRGIRVPDDSRLLFPAFDGINAIDEIEITARSTEADTSGLFSYKCRLHNDSSGPYITLQHSDRTVDLTHAIKEPFQKEIARLSDLASTNSAQKAISSIEDLNRWLEGLGVKLKIATTNALGPETLLQSFLIYSPEFRTLRNFNEEGQIVPLGIYGEGLFRLLTVLSSEDGETFSDLKKRLASVDWFEDFDFAPTATFGDRSLRIKDKYFDPSVPEMSQRSSNEGFLFLLFYFCLFISDLTPKFFAVDNIDASLNPKLCARLIVQLTELAKKHDKQAIFTTHNPAVLDGLNLDDDEQRLFVVYRNKHGHTTAKRVMKPKPLPGQEPVKLSEMFMRGYLGGLPGNF